MCRRAVKESLLRSQIAKYRCRLCTQSTRGKRAEKQMKVALDVNEVAQTLIWVKSDKNHLLAVEYDYGRRERGRYRPQALWEDAILLSR
jgi:hypothetical protein